MTDHLAAFPRFVQAVARRLEAGRIAFGDRSFARPPVDLITEIQEELEDVCAWSYILHRRLSDLRARIAASDEMKAALPSFSVAPAPEPTGRRAAEPFIAAVCGVPVTAAQRAALLELEARGEAITEATVHRVRDQHPRGVW